MVYMYHTHLNLLTVVGVWLKLKIYRASAKRITNH
jgi:hypothetical protein